jgi:hypothetical protein
MTGPWKAWKSKSSFSTLSPVPWKSRKRREISTFPQPLRLTQVKIKTGGGRRSVGYGKVEIQKQDSHFPTAPMACGARMEQDCYKSEVCYVNERPGRSGTECNSLTRQKGEVVYTDLLTRPRLPPQEGCRPLVDPPRTRYFSEPGQPGQCDEKN